MDKSPRTHCEAYPTVVLPTLKVSESIVYSSYAFGCVCTLPSTVQYSTVCVTALLEPHIAAAQRDVREQLLVCMFLDLKSGETTR